MSTIIFDIETEALPQEELDAFAPEFKAPANLKDPEKIRQAIEDKREAYYNDAALSPVTGRVLSIGLEIDGEFQNWSTDFISEQAVLEDFWVWVLRETDSDWIGFNIAHFDLPFLIRRSMKYGFKAPMVFDRYGKLTGQFVDLMKVWQCGSYGETISLDRLSRFLGVGQKNGDGKDYASLFRRDRNAALEYLKNDLTLTRKCAERMGILTPKPHQEFVSSMPS